MQSLRQLLEHWIQRIGRHTLDNELPARDTDRERLTLVHEKDRQPVYDPVHSEIEQWMAAWIDRVLVQGYRQLDEEIREVARECGHSWSRRRLAR